VNVRDDPDGSLRLARQYAQQAKEPLAHCIAALVALFERDHDKAQSEIDIALSLNPSSPFAHNILGSIRNYAGQSLKAIPEIERDVL
jgi:hypothetical protein